MVALSTVLLSPLATRLAGEIIDSVKGPFGKVAADVKLLLKAGFGEFFSKQIARYSQVRTILGSHTPLRLEDVYVNLQLGFDDETMRDDDVLTKLPDQKRMIVTATAGAGKSMLMKYLYFIFLQNQRDFLPIFIELRELNESPTSSLIDVIARRVAEHVEQFNSAFLQTALHTGSVALFLDGYDEIDHDRRHARGREIMRLADQYPDALMVVSSRPDQAFNGWSTFFLYHLRQLTEEQVRLLIEKIPYDLSIKHIFIKKLDAGLYLTHREFLTNPLLTVMMLITLEQFADVPAKVHLFYEYAFEALFAKHDVTKGGFQRKRYVDIALDDYRRLFSYFCTITYMRQSFSFSETAALDHLRQAVTASQIPVRQNEMLLDLCECTCMLAREGLDLVFSHRSFQEYFVAYFLSRIKVEELPRVAPKLIGRADMDNVFLMISEMNQEKFEESWALQTLNKMLSIVGSIDANENPFDFIFSLFGVRTFRFVNGVISVQIEDQSDIVNERMALYKCYAMFDKIHARLEKFDHIYMEPAKPHTGELVYQAIRNGTILRDDIRFAKIREGNTAEVITVILTKEDNSWLRDTSIGRFIGIEGEELRKLHQLVSNRVRLRQDGLGTILMLQ